MNIHDLVICQFKFVCSERWETLTPIEGSDTSRFCSSCNSPVYVVQNYQELVANAASKRCVAIFLNSSTTQQTELIGLVVPSIPSPTLAGSPLLSRAIDELEMSESIDIVLKANGVKAIHELLRCTKEQLQNEFGFEEIQIKEIEEVIQSRGFTHNL